MGDAGVEAYEYNELKLLILESIGGGICSVNDLLSLGSRESISMALMRYHRMGLLHRFREGHCYVYSLTLRGDERLEYLRKLRLDDMEVDDSSDE